MPHIFLDTCVVKYRYTKHPRYDAYRQKINRLIGNRNNRTYIADATILEICSAFGGYCRDNGRTIVEYDAMDRSFMQDLANGTFIIRPANKQQFILRARKLLRLGGMVHRRGFGSTDALIASCALDLAQELQQRVRFFTSDHKLNGVIPLIDAFTANMELNFLPVPPPIPATPPPAAGS